MLAFTFLMNLSKCEHFYERTTRCTRTCQKVRNFKRHSHGVEELLVVVVALVLAHQDVQLVDQLSLHLEIKQMRTLKIRPTDLRFIKVNRKRLGTQAISCK